MNCVCKQTFFYNLSQLNVISIIHLVESCMFKKIYIQLYILYLLHNIDFILIYMRRHSDVNLNINLSCMPVSQYTSMSVFRMPVCQYTNMPKCLIVHFRHQTFSPHLAVISGCYQSYNYLHFIVLSLTQSLRHMEAIVNCID